MKTKLLAVTFASALIAGCGFFATNAMAAAPTAAQEKAAPAMSHDELVKLAQKEGSVTIYSNSSRHSKAGELFEKKYGIKIFSTQLKDVEIIEKIAKEAAANIKGADLVFVQDSGRVFGELLAPGYLVNYIPPAMADKLDPNDTKPLVFMFLNKALVFNNEKGEASAPTNLWQLTDPAWKGRFQMKDPFQEGVNMNFMTMLTKPDVAARLAKAHKDHYGKDVVLTTPNAGYEWIKRLYANDMVLGTSDTKISESVGVKGQPAQLAALVTLNKLRVAASKNLALDVASQVNPFSGFYYPMYCMLPSNSRNTNAAKLFAEFMLTPEGFAPWSDSMGDFSSNPAIPVGKGDLSLKEWGNFLVREDPKWCFTHRAEVEDFINSII